MVIKLDLAKYLIFLVILSSCGNKEKEIRHYGFMKKQNDSLNVSLSISEFKDYGNFIDRIRKITCNDSIPKIIIEKKDLIRNIYPIEYCEPMTFDPEAKHYVTFTRGKAYKDPYPNEIKLDSLSWILENDYAYHWTSTKSDSLICYFIVIESNRAEKVDGIESFLTQLSHEFDNLNTKLDLNISFLEISPYIPPTVMGSEIMN